MISWLSRPMHPAAPLILAAIGVVKLVAGDGGWWAITLIVVGLVASATLLQDLIATRRRARRSS
jgi:hypothetical protein